MQFLAPLFLAALAALAIPLALHLRRQQPKGTVPFSAVQFLTPARLRVRRRMRFEDILLLALRCLGLALLVLAFARPFFAGQKQMAAAATTFRLILVDVSASMRGEKIEQARDAAVGILRDSGSNDKVAIATFGKGFALDLPFDEESQSDPREAEAAVRAIQAGWGSTNLATALIAAADVADRARAESESRVEIHVISDFQRGSSTGELAGQNWPDGLRFIPVRIGGTNWTNVGVHPVATDNSAGTLLRGQITNATGSASDQFTVQWDGGSPTRVTVQAGTSASLTAPQSDEPATVEVDGDTFDFDNRAWLVPPTVSMLTIDYFGEAKEDDSTDSLFFLKRALQPTATAEFELRVRPGESDSKANFTIVDGASKAPPDLKTRLEDGESILLVLRDAGDAAILEKELIGSGISAEEIVPAEPALIGEVNFDNPVLEPFADPAFSNFSRIATWKYRRVAMPDGAESLLRFASGDPMLMRIPVGNGSLYVLTTSWRPSDTQLALSSKFAPLLHSLIHQAEGGESHPTNVWVGDSVRLPKEVSEEVRTPGGRTESAQNHTFTHVDEPGLYRTADDRFTFAANVRPSETEIAPLRDDALEAIGLPLGEQSGPISEMQRQSLAREELERRQKWWWWLVLGAIVVFVLESVFAGLRPRQIESTA